MTPRALMLRHDVAQYVMSCDSNDVRIKSSYAKHGQQICTRSGGDAHHAWSCGNDVVAHCLYTGMHSVAANSRDKHFLVLIGSLGKEERLTFLTEEQ